MAQAISRINPSSLPDSGEMGYSQISIVEPGRMAYISGQVAWQLNGEAVPESLALQAEIVAKNAKAALDVIGAGPNDIAIARIFLCDMNSETMNEALPPLLEMFDGAQPSITGVGVAALAAPELKIEMELTVRLPD